MDWTNEASQLAELAIGERPQVLTHGRRLIFRGCCAAGVCQSFLTALSRYLVDDQRLPAVMASDARSDGRWAAVTTLPTELADEDWSMHIADAGLRALGLTELDLLPGYYDLLADQGFQAHVWQALAAGRAGPDLVAAVLSAEA